MSKSNARAVSKVKLTIIKLGRPAFTAYEELVKVYQKRISAYLPIEEHIIRATEEKESQRKLEKFLSSKSCNKNSSDQTGDGLLIVLDEKGLSCDSMAFARHLGAWRDNPRVKTITFLIGGPYGVSEALKKRADMVLCLSPLIFTSDMAWLIIWEQIYRAFTILNRQPYHHE